MTIATFASLSFTGDVKAATSKLGTSRSAVIAFTSLSAIYPRLEQQNS